MASRREVVVATENYLRSKGYNNSTGKYDRVIMGVKSLLGETLLTYGSPEFERAIQQETERMLKKYVKDEAMEYDPIACMMVPKKTKDSWTTAYQEFTKIVNKYFPNEKKIESEVKALYERNKNNPDYKEAYRRWMENSNDEMPANMVTDQRTVDFSSSDARDVFKDIDKYFQKSLGDIVRKIEAAKTPEECEKLENQARKDMEDIMDEYLQIWNMVGLYAQHARNDVSSSYKGVMGAAYKRYNALSSK